MANGVTMYSHQARRRESKIIAAQQRSILAQQKRESRRDVLLAERINGYKGTDEMLAQQLATAYRIQMEEEARNNEESHDTDEESWSAYGTSSDEEEKEQEDTAQELPMISQIPTMRDVLERKILEQCINNRADGNKVGEAFITAHKNDSYEDLHKEYDDAGLASYEESAAAALLEVRKIKELRDEDVFNRLVNNEAFQMCDKSGIFNVKKFAEAVKGQYHLEISFVEKLAIEDLLQKDPEQKRRSELVLDGVARFVQM